MAFVINMEAAARRHLAAADCLMECGCRGTAGYVYGLAAECAVKAMMLEAGLPKPADPTDRDHAYYKHFPELRTQLRDKLKGRRAKPLATFIQDDRFMANWSLQMRYSDGKKIKEIWLSSWSEQASQIVACIGT